MVTGLFLRQQQRCFWHAESSFKGVNAAPELKSLRSGIYIGPACGPALSSPVLALVLRYVRFSLTPQKRHLFIEEMKQRIGFQNERVPSKPRHCSSVSSRLETEHIFIHNSRLIRYHGWGSASLVDCYIACYEIDDRELFFQGAFAKLINDLTARALMVSSRHWKN